ncbi:MAG TPA: Fic family protein [Ferruginibacter sp.]|nr:Fic family protein [Ignavibacteriaceae bacterium]HRO05037.1 Fic family protein [Ferruginibacter sp.]
MKALEKAPKVEDFFQAGNQRIAELIFSNEFNQVVNDVNESYLYWDKVKYIKVPKGSTPEEVWAVAKIRRNNTPYRVSFGKYDFSWFLNTKIQELLHLFDLNIGGSLVSHGIIPKDERNRYLLSSIMEEAIASSQIEGAITTRKQAKDMLRKNTSPRNKSEQMILNNFRTIQQIIEWKNENITVDKLLEIHKLVTNKTLDNAADEGTFREDNEVKVVDVLDGEVVHYPPSHVELKLLIQQLIDYFNLPSDGVFVHPIIKASVIHFMIGYIHPFVDGNGRTARALFYWFLLKNGYWLTEYMSISRMILKSKSQYARAFLYTETDQNDMTYFILYQLKTMKLAFDSLKEYIKRKIEEKRQISDFLKISNVNERQALILKWIYEEPSLVFTVKEIQTRLQISNQTARTDLQGLYELGYLDLLSVNKKTQAFSKSTNFDELLKYNAKIK